MGTNVIDELLVLASATGNLKEVKELLRKKADIHYKNELGQTALMAAVLSERPEIVEVLLQKGSNPDVKDNNELNPFIAAGANGFADLLKLMASYGADSRSINRFGGTALLPASEKGYTKTVQNCLEAGVPVDHSNKLGWTALHEAVILGDGGHLYAVVIQLLLEAGADIHIRDRKGLSPLEYAQKLGQQRISPLFEGATMEGAVHAELFALYKAGHYKKGLAVIEKVSSASEGSSLLYFWKGLLLQESREYREAIAVYREGLEIGIEGIQFHFCIAQCFRLMKQPAEALAAFDKGREENPESPFFLYHKSNYLRELSLHSEAVNAMEQLLENLPERPDFLFHKANSLRVIERYSEAVHAMEEALALDPDNELFKEHRILSLKLLNNKRKWNLA